MAVSSREAGVTGGLELATLGSREPLRTFLLLTSRYNQLLEPAVKPLPAPSGQDQLIQLRGNLRSRDQSDYLESHRDLNSLDSHLCQLLGQRAVKCLSHHPSLFLSLGLASLPAPPAPPPPWSPARASPSLSNFTCNTGSLLRDTHIPVLPCSQSAVAP